MTVLEVIKLFSCSTDLNTKFILLINLKMRTIVCILTFISKINASSESFKARKSFYMQNYDISLNQKFGSDKKEDFDSGFWGLEYQKHIDKKTGIIH